MDLGPETRRVLDSVLPSHTQSARGPTTSPCPPLNIKEHEMSMWIIDVVIVLIVDRGNISCHALAKALCEGAYQDLSLR